MSDIRKHRAFDGRCTVFAGEGLIISDLSDETADVVVAHLRGSPPTSGARSVGGRHLKASPDSPRMRASGRRTN